MTGTPEGSTESSFIEKPGIEPATPGLQGIALIHYTTGASQDYLTWVKTMEIIIRLLCRCAAVSAHEAYIAHTAPKKTNKKNNGNPNLVKILSVTVYARTCI